AARQARPALGDVRLARVAAAGLGRLPPAHGPGPAQVLLQRADHRGGGPLDRFRRRPSHRDMSAGHDEDLSAVTVVVVDEHPIWREGVARDLTACGFSVLATVADSAYTARIAAATQPRVVVIDLDLE